jgi:hypothetical protein
MPASGANGRPAAVQVLLTELFRAPVTVDRWERLEPWAVARVLLGGAGAARTVIVKWVRTGPAQARTEPGRLRAELAALQFLSGDLGLALAPRVIAADVPAGFRDPAQDHSRVPCTGARRVRDGGSQGLPVPRAGIVSYLR